MQRNRFDKRDSLEIGMSAEDKFKKLAKKLGWEVTRATKDQDRIDHFDFTIKKYAEEYKIEVKAMKRIHRSGEIQDEWVWIELQGVTGHPGWIYGKADIIAFQRPNGFLLVKRKWLLEKVTELVPFTGEVVHSAKEAKYKYYSRNGRDDLLTMIRLTDIEKHGTMMFEEIE